MHEILAVCRNDTDTRPNNRTLREKKMQLELLESRRLLSTVQFVGTFTGTEEHMIDGTEVSETIDVAAVAGKKGVTNIELTIHDNLKSVSYVLPESFAPKSSTATTDLTATIPSSIGSGTIAINAGQSMSISATLDTGIFAPLTFTFVGTRVTSKAKSSEAMSVAATTTATSPDVGLFIGHMTASSSGTEYTTKTNIRINSKGHPAIDLLLSDPDFDCSIEIASAIHPTHTGTFALDLGTEVVDGVLRGHITHTGRLVLDLDVAGFSSLSGSQKRH